MSNLKPSFFHDRLVFKKPEDHVDLKLLDNARTLTHSGKLYTRPEAGAQALVLLFDHYLVITQPETYHVKRRPILLDLVTIINSSDPQVSASKGSSKGFLRSLMRKPESSKTGNTSDTFFPLTLGHAGREIILYAESSIIRAEWTRRIEGALEMRRIHRETDQVFQVRTLNSKTFSAASSPHEKSALTNQDPTLTGDVTCSALLTSPSRDALVAIGCAEGVWIGQRDYPKSYRRVLNLKGVTQCAVLENFNVFLVLADKSLWGFHIDALVVVGMSPEIQVNQVPHKVNGNVDVEYFTVGRQLGRTFLLYMKKKGWDSVYRILEPVPANIKRDPNAKPGPGPPVNTDWFRKYREYFAMQKTFGGILFGMKPHLSAAILCTKGVELVELSDMSSTTVPVMDKAPSELVKRCKDRRPVGLFKATESEFLLCYDDFGLYIDKEGKASTRSAPIVEWEGTAESAALHQPYVFIFNTSFIEIHEITTGRLVQIIPGTRVRCLLDGLQVDTGPDEEGQGRIHVVMDEEETASRGGGENQGHKVAWQRVIELVPSDVSLDLTV